MYFFEYFFYIYKICTDTIDEVNNESVDLLD